VGSEEGSRGDVFTEMDGRKCDLLSEGEERVDRETEHGSCDSGPAEEGEVEDGGSDTHHCGGDPPCEGKLEKSVGKFEKANLKITVDVPLTLC